VAGPGFGLRGGGGVVFVNGTGVGAEMA